MERRSLCVKSEPLKLLLVTDNAACGVGARREPIHLLNLHSSLLTGIVIARGALGSNFVSSCCLVLLPTARSVDE